MNSSTHFQNPYKPGAGHKPPYLAGRNVELEQFGKFLTQATILKNVVLTGLRGVGKTVLLEEFKEAALAANWLWVGTDLSESASIDEQSLCSRLIADLSILTSGLSFQIDSGRTVGMHSEPKKEKIKLDFEFLMNEFKNTPGLNSDKLKKTLILVWKALQQAHSEVRGIIFAYDESQNLENHPSKEQFPASLLLDVFQSVQRQDISMMLVLTGLPTLFPKLVEARTFAERMFEVIFLNRLSDEQSKDALIKPIETANCPVRLDEKAVKNIIKLSGGYPYFIQFIGREVYDAWLQRISAKLPPSVPADEIIQKLDKDFFSGRWAKATDRQRDLLYMISNLPNCNDEFSVHDIVEESRKYRNKVFSSSHVNQMLSHLINSGLLYKNRHGRYSFAVPLLGDFIKRNYVINQQ